MRRISIRTLMAFVLVSAVGLAALRNANELWSGMMLLTALVAVGVAALGAVFTCGKERAFWVGFAFFGGGYLGLTVGPWVSDTFRHQLGTPHLIGYIYELIFLSDAKLFLLEKQALEAELARRKQTTQNSGHDPTVSAMTRSIRAIQAQLTANKNAGIRYGPFQRVGHSLFALLAGLIGGTVAVWFYARRERAEAAAGGVEA
jgi:MFS family permease